jgi:hypothetical protein
MSTSSQIILISIMLWASNLNAATVGVGIKVVTLGYGADFSVALNNTVSARVVFDSPEYS